MNQNKENSLPRNCTSRDAKQIERNLPQIETDLNPIETNCTHRDAKPIETNLPQIETNLNPTRNKGKPYNRNKLYSVHALNRNSGQIHRQSKSEIENMRITDTKIQIWEWGTRNPDLKAEASRKRCRKTKLAGKPIPERNPKNIAKSLLDLRNWEFDQGLKVWKRNQSNKPGRLEPRRSLELELWNRRYSNSRSLGDSSWPEASGEWRWSLGSR